MLLINTHLCVYTLYICVHICSRNHTFSPHECRLSAEPKGRRPLTDSTCLWKLQLRCFCFQFNLYHDELVVSSCLIDQRPHTLTQFKMNKDKGFVQNLENTGALQKN